MTTQQPIRSIQEAKQPLFLGIDVGGTNIKIGLVDNIGQTLAYTTIETEEPRGPEDAMQRVVQATKSMLAPTGVSLSQIARVGLGTPGSQDIPRGMLIAPPNHPHWHNFPIVACLEKAIGLKVSYANDANAAAWGEFWIGSGAMDSSMILLTLGTGVGGGIIIDNQLVVGHNSFGGEVGHMIVDFHPEARLCVWGGGRGHLEAYASASAVAQRAKELLTAGAVSSLSSNIEEVTSRQLFEAAEAGDTFSLELIDSTADYLALGITSMVHILDPGLVVLGGAMNFGGNQSSVGRRFLDRIRSVFRSRSFEYVAAGTKIDFASLGGDAGYLGAAGIAQAEYTFPRKTASAT
ncbi:MAG: ROK family protein [Pirellulaceae bacterium]|nr:ROK family protein [Pirellulaceae bacterium]